MYVHEITPEFLTDWMGTWKDETHYSKGKKRKNINAFFRHCLAQHWIKRNPAEGMPKISERNQPSATPKIPFTRLQMVAILHAAANYHRNLNGHSADLEAAARVRGTKRSRNWTHGSAIPPRSIILRLAVGGGSRPDCQWCCGSPIGSEVPSSVPQTVVTIGGSAAG